MKSGDSMNAQYLKNFSLSVCLGLFTFHLYVVNTYTLSEKKSAPIVLDYKRTPANVQSLEDCTLVASDEFEGKDEKDTCFYSLESNAERQCTISIRFNSVREINDFSLGNDESCNKETALSRVHISIDTTDAENTEEPAEAVVDEGAISPPAAAAAAEEEEEEAAEDPVASADSDATPAVTTAEPVAALDDDEDYESILSEDKAKKIVEDLKSLKEEVDQCRYSTRVYKSIRDSYRRVRNVRRFIDDKKDYEDLKEADLEMLAELEDLIADARDEELEGAERAQCIIDRALAIQSQEEQYDFYKSEVVPLLGDSELAGSIDQGKISQLASSNRFIAFEVGLSSAFAQRHQAYQAGLNRMNQDLASTTDEAVRQQKLAGYESQHDAFIQGLESDLSSIQQNCIQNNQGRNCPFGALVQKPSDVSRLQEIFNSSKSQWATTIPFNAGTGTSANPFGSTDDGNIFAGGSGQQVPSGGNTATPSSPEGTITQQHTDALAALRARVAELRAEMARSTVRLSGQSRGLLRQAQPLKDCGNSYVPGEGCRVTDFSTPDIPLRGTGGSLQ